MPHIFPCCFYKCCSTWDTSRIPAKQIQQQAHQSESESISEQCHYILLLTHVQQCDWSFEGYWKQDVRQRISKGFMFVIQIEYISLETCSDEPQHPLTFLVAWPAFSLLAAVLFIYKILFIIINTWQSCSSMKSWWCHCPQCEGARAKLDMLLGRNE